MFGVFEHYIHNPQNPIFRGFDDVFYVPHSRYTEVRAEDIKKNPELVLLSESDESGVYMVMGRNGREFFITGRNIRLLLWMMNIKEIWQKVCLSTCQKIITEKIILPMNLWYVGEVMPTCCLPIG